MKILVTGTAGFIGFHLATRLLSEGHEVVGFDNINDYYDVGLKYDRLKKLGEAKDFSFVKGDLADASAVNSLFEVHSPSYVVNLAAQAGVRYSLQNPKVYIDSNVTGFLNILEACRHNNVKHLVYASTSSVYGLNRKLPFSTEDSVDHPISLYAATKKSNELMAHSCSHLFNIPTTGLRFFTVYGPWGRPDMALFLFAEAITRDQPINIFNHGKMKRDFTYIDDIVQGISKVIFVPAEKDSTWDGIERKVSTSSAPYRVFNIGNNRSVDLLYAIELLENELGKKAIKNFMPMQAGDVEATFADVDALRDAVGYEPTTPIETGVKKFAEWYKFYYGKQ